MDKIWKYGRTCKIWKNMENMEMKVLIFESYQRGKCVFRAFQNLSNSGKKYGFPYNFEGGTTRAQWSNCTVRQLHRGQLHSGQLHSKVLFIRKTTCPFIRKTPVYSRNSPNKRKSHSPISHNFVHNHPMKMILVSVDSPRRALSNEL